MLFNSSCHLVNGFDLVAKSIVIKVNPHKYEALVLLINNKLVSVHFLLPWLFFYHKGHKGLHKGHRGFLLVGACTKIGSLTHVPKTKLL